jgi:hypothetical protein
LHVPGQVSRKYAGALAAILLLDATRDAGTAAGKDATDSSDILGSFLQSRSTWLAAALKSGHLKIAAGTKKERLAANVDAILSSLSALLRAIQVIPSIS